MGGHPSLQETPRLWRTMDNSASATWHLAPNEGVRVTTRDYRGLSSLYGEGTVRAWKCIRATYSSEESPKDFWKLIASRVPIRTAMQWTSVAIRSMLYTG